MKDELARRASSKDRILALLIERGNAGVTNEEMNDDICYRYGGRIRELREEGHVIRKEHVKGGLFRYVYEGVRAVETEPLAGTPDAEGLAPPRTATSEVRFESGANPPKHLPADLNTVTAGDGRLF